MCPSFCDEKCMPEQKIDEEIVSDFPEPEQTTPNTTTTEKSTTTIVTTTTSQISTSGFQIYFPKVSMVPQATEIVQESTVSPGLF